MTTQPKAAASRSEEVVRKHKEYLWPAVANYYQHPLVADHASMQYLWDVEGNKYLDFFGGIVTVGVGHCNPKVTSKIKAQVDKLQHTSTLFPNEAIVALAEKLARDHAGQIAEELFHQLRHRSQRSRDPARAHGQPELRHCGAAPRLFRLIGAREERHGARCLAQVRRHQRRRRARRQPVLLPLPAASEISRLRRRLRQRRRGSDPDRHQRLDCRLHRRADSGRRRIHHAAARIFQDRLPHREKLRRPFHLRRSADRLRAHRQEMVRHRAVGSDARHHHLREEHGQRRARRRDDHHVRARRQIPGPHDFDLRRQSGHVRRRARRDRSDRRRKPAGEYRTSSAATSASSSKRCRRNTRSSATFAAWA